MNEAVNTAEAPPQRVVINGVRPTTPDRVSDAKAVVGRPLVVSANVFADGHDELAARVWWRSTAVDAKEPWRPAPMISLVNDRWEASIVPERTGRHEVVIEGWVDHHATWRRRVTAKVAAGQDVEADVEEEALRLDEEVDGDRLLPWEKKAVAAAARALRDARLALHERLAPALSEEVLAVLARLADRRDTTRSPVQHVWADRERSAIGAWYELFPRSYGGLAGAARRLRDIAAMGFDVAYLPPIHPIGSTARKGPGNALAASAGDPGSPWAIGSAEGGHTAVHPELGTLADFDNLVTEAGRLGLEVALDYALQCSPDHPWVRQHPEWFMHRPDGTIRFAENPPKQYQDIYPLNFLPPNDRDRRALWEACRDVMEFWIDHGVHIFRVDNPHTKPFPFWQWLLTDVRTRHPEIVFLAEAFTRPRIMERLAEIGFSQSYTYFTWRTSRDELAAYGEELAHGPASDYFRPNLWPNTPDILSGPLRRGPIGAFKMRAALAALLGPSWGVYSGYELGENEPASETNEEYARSEKYEVVQRDWAAPWSIAPYLAGLNGIRRRHPAISDLGSLRFHGATGDELLVFSKQFAGDTVLVVVNLDPHSTQEGTLELDLGALGLPWAAPLTAFDEISGQTFPWSGPNPYVRLTPDEPAHVIALSATP
jgi:starch synthase (maltosyl-transferring)